MTDPVEPLEPGFELLAQSQRRVPGRLLASIGAVCVLGAGAAVTYVAFAAGDSGASTPKAAVQHVIDDLAHADLLGLVDDLAPGERAALAQPVRSDLAALKRLGVLTKSANASSVSGVHFSPHDLTYAKTTTRINDHVQIVEITGGTVELGGDVARLPLTKQVLGRIKVNPAHSSTSTVAITRPIRIATEKVGDTWYASLFYTIADRAAHSAVPTSADAIPAAGTGSADAAVRRLITALGTGDYRSAIAVLSPDELGALHDYGGMLVGNSGTSSTPALNIKTLKLADTPVDGGVRVELTKVIAQVRGMQVSLAVDNGCYRVDAGPVHKRICAADAAELVAAAVGNFRCLNSFNFGASSYSPLAPTTPSSSVPFGHCAPRSFDTAQKQAITDLFTGLMKGTGVLATNVDGKWFVAPVRTFAQESADLLSALRGNDLWALASLG